MKFSKDQANFCLQKWKRMNARAKIDDIIVALTKINREDIVTELEAQFKNAYSNEPKKKFTIQEAKKIESEILHLKLQQLFKNKKNEDANRATEINRLKKKKAEILF